MAQASQFPFQPLGQTALIVGNTPASTPVQVPTFNSTQSYGQYRIVNASTNTVFLGVGGTAAQATARAAAIVAGTPAFTLVLVPGAVEIVRFANDSFFAAFAASASDVYITPGQGL